MESYGPTSHHLHVPRRLTKLYTDTKNSCDNIAEKDRVADVPELSALHRKFRIQKDRLIAWGVKWSDDSAASGSIDESVEKAGLTEIVTNVLGTIKDILEEAERICDPSKPSSLPSEKAITTGVSDRRWSLADKARYEDLQKDLTASIDILDDLSKSRKALREGTYGADLPSGSSPSTFDSEETLVNPSRRTTFQVPSGLERPPKIDLSMLILPDEAPPPYENFGPPSTTRVIAHLRRTITSSNPWKSDGSKTVSVPVLIEYAPFDAIYRDTGVHPQLQRLEALLDFYARSRPNQGNRQFGILSCIGYFEDPKQPRYGLVYELPSHVHSGPSDAQKNTEAFKPAPLLRLLQDSSKSNRVAGNISAGYVPPLEVRFRLAFNLVNSFRRIHDERLVHGDVNSNNVLAFLGVTSATPPPKGRMAAQYDLRKPYIDAYDLFSECNVTTPVEAMPLNIYRHYEDPKASNMAGSAFPQYDVYGLGLILLEIGLWVPLGDIYKMKYSLRDFKVRLDEIWVQRLAAKCGGTYMKAVQCCLALPTHLQQNDVENASAISQCYDLVLGRLQRCCLLEEGVDDVPIPISRSTTGSMRSSAAFFEKDQWSFLQTVPENQRASSTHAPAKHAPRMRWNTAPLAATEEPFSAGPEGNHDATISPEMCQAAAATIQRHWRAFKSRRESPTYQQYSRKVTDIQSQLRERAQKLAERSPTLRRISSRSQVAAAFGASATTHPPSLIRERTLKVQQDNEPHFANVITPIQEPTPRPKLKIHPVKLPAAQLDEWHNSVLPRLERVVERALKDSNETVSIDLLSVGETLATAKPTIFVTCTSTAKVKSTIYRKFANDPLPFDLKVKKGKIRRSKYAGKSKKHPPPHRSMVNEENFGREGTALNPFHQQRPLCGASIGAWKGEHLPPVSYGGVVLVDGEPYGMSVHHMFEPQSDDEESECGEDAVEGAYRSSAPQDSDSLLAGMVTEGSFDSNSDYPGILEISDEEDFSSDLEYDSPEEEDDSDLESLDLDTCGDIPGVARGDGENILITQPALDDVDDNFFPQPDDKDEDHLDSHMLGHVHASSGIRRWRREGVLHEIDWALLKLDDDRLQPYNLVQGGRRFSSTALSDYCPTLVPPVCRGKFPPDDDEYPNRVAKSTALGARKVHCFGRTSGLKSGKVGEVMSSVRIYQRKTFSRSWAVHGGFGVGGDSGAWVIDNEHGGVCGHILAWCDRTQVAYICPMDVLIEDMKSTLGAAKICLPGGEKGEAMAFIDNEPLSEVSPNRLILDDKEPQAKAQNLPDIDSLSITNAVRSGIPTSPRKSESARSRQSNHPGYFQDVRHTTGQLA